MSIKTAILLALLVFLPINSHAQFGTKPWGENPWGDGAFYYGPWGSAVNSGGNGLLRDDSGNLVKDNSGNQVSG